MRCPSRREGIGLGSDRFRQESLRHDEHGEPKHGNQGQPAAPASQERTHDGRIGSSRDVLDR
jgi:hypothetical protein